MSNDKNQNLLNFRRKPTKKFVKKASQWCVTSWKNGKQVQEWFDKEPNFSNEKR